MPRSPSPSRREALLLTGAGMLVLVAAASMLALAWHPVRALQWLLQAMLLWLPVAAALFARLERNRPAPDAPLYDSLGWANRATALRGLLIAATGGFVFQPDLTGAVVYVPAVLYSIAAILDRIDGTIARVTRHRSMLGETLDTELDALGLAVAPLLALWLGQIHWSYLSVSAAYYLFQGGIAWRGRHALPVRDLPANITRRTMAGFQMGFIAIVLWPPVGPPATVIGGVACMIPVLTGFLIDWLTVRGTIDPLAAPAKPFLDRCRATLERVVLPLLRIAIAPALILRLTSGAAAATGNPGLDLLAGTAVIVSAAMVLLGIAGRAFAVALVVLFAWLYFPPAFTAADVLLIAAAVWIMQLGTGRYNLWRGDDAWVNRYDGI